MIDFDVVKELIEILKSWGLSNAIAEILLIVVIALFLITFFIQVFLVLKRFIYKNLVLPKHQRLLSGKIYKYFRPSEIKNYVKNYIPAYFQEEEPSNDRREELQKSIERKKLLPFLLKEALSLDKDDKYIAILADSGMGKTTLLINLYILYRKQREIKRPLNVEYFPLADPGTEQLIADLPNKYETLLLLDGFDEDIKAIGRQEERLRELIVLTEPFRKIILTSRTHFFTNKEREPNETGIQTYGNELEPLRFRKIYLSLFNDHDVKRYLRKRYVGFFTRKRRKASKIVNRSPSLMARPMLLNSIDDLLRGKSSYDFSFQIYNQLLEAWSLREAKKRNIRTKNKMQFETFQKELFQFSKNLTLDVYQKRDIYGGLHVPIEDLSQPDNELFTQDDLQTRSFLSRNDLYYRFSHRSIMEYFLAKYLFEHPEKQADFSLEALENTDLFFQEMVAYRLRLCKGTYSTSRFRNKALTNLKPAEFLHIRELNLEQVNGISVDHLKKMTSITPKGWTRLAISYNNQSNYSQAIKCWQRVVEAVPNHWYAWLNMGFAHFDNGDCDQVLYCWQKVEETHPDLHEICLLIGVIYHNQCNFQKTIQYWQKVIEVYPEDHQTWHSLGVAYSNLEDYIQAIHCWKKVVEVHPVDYQAWFYMGVAFANLENYNKAITCFQKSIDIKPDFRKNMLKYFGYPILTIYKLGDGHTTIEKAFQYADEKSEDLAMNLGHYHFLSDKIDQALVWYRKGLEITIDKAAFYKKIEDDFNQIYLENYNTSEKKVADLLHSLMANSNEAH